MKIRSVQELPSGSQGLKRIERDLDEETLIEDGSNSRGVKGIEMDSREENYLTLKMRSLERSDAL